MPVQVPQIKRLAPAAPESAGRLDVSVPGSLMENDRGNQILKAGSDIVSAYQKAELEGAELTATDVATQYKSQRKVKLSELEQLDGDPTKAYADFDAESEKWQKDFEDKYKDAPEVTRRLIKQKISEAHALSMGERVVQEGVQRKKYDGKVTDAAVESAKASVMAASFTFDPKDRDSELRFEAAVNSIRTPMIENGGRYGGAEIERDTKGKIVSVKDINPVLQQEIKKKVSEGVKSAIENLNNLGQTEKAQYLLNKYKDELTPEATNLLLKGSKEAVVEQEAYKALAQIPTRDPKAAAAWIDKNIKNPEVAEKARQKLATKTAQDAAFQNQSQQKAYDFAIEYAQKYQAKHGEFRTKDQLFSDPEIKALLPRMGDMQAKFERVMLKPSESDVSVKAKMYDLKNSPTFAQMSYEQLTVEAAGLDKKDFAFFEREWREARDPKYTEQKSKFNSMSSDLKQKMINAGLLKKNVFGKLASLRDEERYTETQDELAVALQTWNPGASIADQRRFVDEFVAQKLKGEAFTGGSFARENPKPPPFQGSVPKEIKSGTTQAPKDPPPKRELSKQQATQALVEWKKRKGEVFNSKKNPAHTAKVLADFYYDELKGQ